MPQVGDRARRSQQERSSATRQAILEAAIRCLVQQGYAATSTTAIQLGAGVSRGALTHQFPSKQALMVAAMRYLAEVRLAAVPDILRDAPSGDGRLEWALRQMWSFFDSDLFFAALELWSASRTDSVLRAALLESEPILGRRHLELVAPAFGNEMSTHPRFRRAFEAVLRQMRGAVLTNLIRREPLPVADIVRDCARLVRVELENGREP